MTSALSEGGRRQATGPARPGGGSLQRATGESGWWRRAPPPLNRVTLEVAAGGRASGRWLGAAAWLLLVGGLAGLCVSSCVGNRARDATLPPAARALTAVSEEFDFGEPLLGWIIGHQRRPRIAASPDGYLVIWLHQQSHTLITPAVWDLYATRLDRSGALLDARAIEIADGVLDAAVSWDGSHYVVAYADIADRQELRSDLRYYHYDVWGVFARRVATDGTVREPIDTPIVAADFSRDIVRNQVAVGSSGTQSLVAWVSDNRRDGADNPRLDGQRLDQAGARAGGAFSIAGGEGRRLAPAVASDGTDFLVAWADGRDGPGAAPTDIHATPVSAAGAVQTADGAVVSAGSSAREGVALAWNGVHYLASWLEVGGAEAAVGIAGRRIGPDGALADAADLVVARPVAQRRPLAAAPMALAGGFLLAWTSFETDGAGSVRVAGIDGGGAVGNPGGRVLGPVAGVGASAFLVPGAPANLVAWDDTGGLPTFDIVIAPLDAQATALAAPARPVTLSPTSHSGAVVASDGTDLLAVWADTRDGVVYRIYARAWRRRRAEGPRWFPDLARPRPAAACGGGLGRWHLPGGLAGGRGGGGRGLSVRGPGGRRRNRRDPQGVRLGPPDSPIDPAVAWSGDSFLVAWRTQSGRIAGMRMKADGTLLDAQPRPWATRGPANPARGWRGRRRMAAGVDRGPRPDADRDPRRADRGRRGRARLPQPPDRRRGHPAMEPGGGLGRRPVFRGLDRPAARRARRLRGARGRGRRPAGSGRHPNLGSSAGPAIARGRLGRDQLPGRVGRPARRLAAVGCVRGAGERGRDAARSRRLCRVGGSCRRRHGRRRLGGRRARAGAVCPPGFRRWPATLTLAGLSPAGSVPRGAGHGGGVCHGGGLRQRPVQRRRVCAPGAGPGAGPGARGVPGRCRSAGSHAAAAPSPRCSPGDRRAGHRCPRCWGGRAAVAPAARRRRVRRLPESRASVRPPARCSRCWPW